jgi:archaellum component FlaG (FlaF/FlaG flagellin family)
MKDEYFDEHSGTSLDDISSDLSSISSDLSSVESNTSTIIDKLGDLRSWLFALFIAGLIGFFIGTADIKFSIPKTYPIIKKSEMVSEGVQRYFVIYNEDFSGSATYTPSGNIIKFLIKNNSNDPQWFDEAKFFMWDKKRTGYGLQVISFENYAFNNQSLILNPNQSIEFTAKTSYTLPPEETEGFSINFKNGPKIRFGYHKFGWWDHLRWWIAEQIRNNKTV